MNLPRLLLLALLLQASALSSLAQLGALLTPTNSIWCYLTNATDPGADWALPGFDDSAWPQGVGLFGIDRADYSPLGFNTPIPAPFFGSGITTYFRTRFNWNGSPAGVIFTGTNYVDDGCVVYLNGVEITRFNMPAGSPAFDTLAIAANPGGFPNLTGGEPVLVRMEIHLSSLTNGNANPLVNGNNVLAVEVHQNSVASSDLVFGMALFAGQCSPPCTDFIQPTNRTILEGQSTTFILGNSNCLLPTPSYQWYRDVGLGEELIPGATASSYTLTNAQEFIDAGVYYCRLTTWCGSVNSRLAVLEVQHTDDPPVFLSASVVGQVLNKFRLVTAEPLCGDAFACGGNYANPFNWQIVQADDTTRELIILEVIEINPATYEFTTIEARDPTRRYRIAVHPAFGGISSLVGEIVPPGTFVTTPPLLRLTRLMNGGVSLNWEVDTNWQLRSASAVNGPYLNTDIPVGTPPGTFSLPAELTTNTQTFFRLEYTGKP